MTEAYVRVGLGCTKEVGKVEALRLGLRGSLLSVLENARCDLVFQFLDLAVLGRNLMTVLDLLTLKFAHELSELVASSRHGFMLLLGLLGLSLGILLCLV